MSDRSAPQVRAATLDDVPAITDIYNHAVEHTTASWDLEPVSLASRTQWFIDKIEHGWPVLVAVDDGLVLGWSTYGPFRPKAGYAGTVEHSVYVRDGVRGRGIGAALLAPLIETARASGLQVMVAGIDAANTGSIAFHERHGFTVQGTLWRVGRKFDRWLDLTFLQLDLQIRPAPRHRT